MPSILSPWLNCRCLPSAASREYDPEQPDTSCQEYIQSACGLYHTLTWCSPTHPPPANSAVGICV